MFLVYLSPLILYFSQGHSSPHYTVMAIRCIILWLACKYCTVCEWINARCRERGIQVCMLNTDKSRLNQTLLARLIICVRNK